MEFRNAQLSIINASPHDLELCNTAVTQGVFITPPPATLAAGCYATFTVQNSELSLEGPQGSVTYVDTDNTLSIVMTWDHPFTATASTYTVTAEPKTSLWTATYPDPITDHQQCVCYWIGGRAFPYQSWMGDIFPCIETKSMREVCLPGTHDSASYSVTDTIAPDAPAFLEELKKLTGDMFMTVVKGWSIAQPPCTPIFDQLMLGARFIDLRVDYDGNTGLLRITHSLYGTTLKDVLAQIAEFAATHPTEFAIISFALYVVPAAQSEVLAQMIDASLGPWLVTRDAKDCTLGDLKSSGSGRLFALYNDPAMVGKYKFLISSDDLWGPWANTDQVDKLQSSLQSYINGRPSTGFFLLNAVLTDQVSTIVNGFLNPDIGTTPHTLQELQWILRPNLEQWLLTIWRDVPLNIIFTDFVAAGTMIPLCIQRNVQGQGSEALRHVPLRTLRYRTLLRFRRWLFVLLVVLAIFFCYYYASCSTTQTVRSS